MNKFSEEQLTLIKKWIKALESNQYDKTYCALRIDNRYSVLGVLCDVFDNSGWNKYTSNVYNWHGDRVIISSEFHARTLTKLISRKVLDWVSYMSDCQGKNFGEVAEWLRTKYKIGRNETL